MRHRQILNAKKTYQTAMKQQLAEIRMLISQRIKLYHNLMLMA